VSRLLEYLNRRNGQLPVVVPPQVKQAQLLTPEDEAELDFSPMKEDKPMIKPLPRRARNQLANNMFWAGLRSAFREASFFSHRMIDRTDQP
jgi:hypothetical protein